MRFLLSLCLFFCLFSSIYAIKCYMCNSLRDTDCLENYERFGQFCPIKSFGAMKGMKPIGCRVSRQKVGEERSTVRECAYLGENIDSKSNKGSMGVQRVFTQCSVNLCNSSVVASYWLPIAAVFLFLFRL